MICSFATGQDWATKEASYRFQQKSCRMQMLLSCMAKTLRLLEPRIWWHWEQEILLESLRTVSFIVDEMSWLSRSQVTQSALLEVSLTLEVLMACITFHQTNCQLAVIALSLLRFKDFFCKQHSCNWTAEECSVCVSKQANKILYCWCIT